MKINRDSWHYKTVELVHGRWFAYNVWEYIWDVSTALGVMCVILFVSGIFIAGAFSFILYWVPWFYIDTVSFLWLLGSIEFLGFCIYTIARLGRVYK